MEHEEHDILDLATRTRKLLTKLLSIGGSFRVTDIADLGRNQTYELFESTTASQVEEFECGFPSKTASMTSTGEIISIFGKSHAKDLCWSRAV